MSELFSRCEIWFVSADRDGLDTHSAKTSIRSSKSRWTEVNKDHEDGEGPKALVVDPQDLVAGVNYT